MSQFPLHEKNKNLVLMNEETLEKQREVVHSILSSGKNIYAFFDTETTGTEPFPKKNDHGEMQLRDRIIELGFILCVDDGNGDIEPLIVDGEKVYFQEYINPSRESEKDLENFLSMRDNNPEAEKVHGISFDFLNGNGFLGGKKLPKPAPTFHEVRPYLDNLLCLDDLINLKGKLIAIGHNSIEFDSVFMSMEMERDDISFNNDIPYPRAFESMVSDVKDTMLMMSALYTREELQGYKEGFHVIDNFGKPMKPGYSMSYLAHMMGVKESGREDFHGALLDAEILMKVFQELIKTPKYQASPNKIPVQNKVNDFIENKIKNSYNIPSLSEDNSEFDESDLDFISLVKTDASLYEGTGTVGEYIGKASKYDISNLALTDVDTLLEFVPFYKKSKDKDIKPIIGCTLKIESVADIFHYLNKNKSKDISRAITNIFNAHSEEKFENLKDLVLSKNFIDVISLQEAVLAISNISDKASAYHNLLVEKEKEKDNKNEVIDIQRFSDSKDSTIYLKNANVKKAITPSKNKVLSLLKGLGLDVKNAKSLNEESIVEAAKIIGDTKNLKIVSRADIYPEITMISRSDEGFHSIRKIITETQKNGQYWVKKDKSKGRGEYCLLSIDFLRNNAHGLNVFVGDFKDIIGRTFRDGDISLSDHLLNEFSNIFNSDVRSQLLGDINFKLISEEEKYRNFEISYISKVLNYLESKNVKCVATQHVSFAEEKDFVTHKNKTSILLDLKVEALNNIPNKTQSQFLKTKEQMFDVFKNNKYLLNNAKKEINSIGINPELDNPKLPEFKTENNISQSDYLIEISNKGLRKRLDVIIDKLWSEYLHTLRYTGEKQAEYLIINHLKDSLKFEENEGDLKKEFGALWKKFRSTKNKEDVINFINKAYQRRLDYELDIINGMGFPGYFLIEEEMIDFSHKNGIPLGSGRGSGAGSLVCYALKITDIDPLEYGLIFERFLNPERAEMPDIDTDILGEKRDTVLEHLQEKYKDFGQGYDGAAYIVTKGTFSAKGTIQAIGKTKNLSVVWQRKLSDLIGDSPGTKISDELEENEELMYRYATESKTKEIIDLSLELESVGRMKNTGVHAGGIVVGNIIESTPISYEKGLPIIQYDKKNCEVAGLVKFDLLGLGTLGKVDLAIKIISERDGGKEELEKFGIKIENNIIDYSRLNYKDPETYELICNGKTVNTFQIESQLFKELLKKIKPKTLEDIADLVSIGRPGPLQSGMDDIYVNGAKDPSSIVYDHELLAPILSETHGAILYQEQVMRIAVDLAGYTKGGADKLRKAMGKKIAAAMEEQREIFVNGCLKHNNIPEIVSEKIFSDMETFAGYGFNKSHAVAYGDLTYKTALLKTHFCVELLTSILSIDASGTQASKKIPKDIVDAKDHGIKIMCPDINESIINFTPLVNEKSILYGLSGIKGTTFDKFVDDRKKNGKYKNMEDLMLRMGAAKGIISLINSGACDKLRLSRPFNSDLSEFDSRVLKVSLKRNLLREEYDVFSKYLNNAKNRKDYSEKSEEEKLMINIDYDSIVSKSKNNKESMVNIALEEENLLLMSYITAHPLDASGIKRKLSKPNVTPPLQSISEIDNLGNKEEYSKIRVAGMVSELDLFKTGKTGAKYGTFDLDDGIYNKRFVVFENQINEILSVCDEKLGRPLKNTDIISVVGHYRYRENNSTGEKELNFGITSIEIPKKNIVIDLSYNALNNKQKLSI